MSTITVELGERSYPIHIEAGILTNTDIITSNVASGRAIVVTNDVVSPLYLDILLKSLKGLNVSVITIPDGEQHKNLQQFE